MGTGLSFPKPRKLEPIDSALTVRAFPKDSNLWRIDWFGPIAFPNRYERNSQPSVLVFISQVEPQTQTYEGLGHYSQQRKLWVSVGTAMLLRIGDIWKNQRPYFEPPHTNHTFSGLVVDRATLSIVKAGSGRADGSFLLPLPDHPWHMNNTHSYCAQVELPSGNLLLIPCMELVRFYFGSSSALLSRIFTPPLTTDMLYTDYGYDERGKLVVMLADFLPADSAEDIARIATSKVALHAAQLIGNSCQQANALGQEAYPMARFPFEGKTDLKVAGRWIGKPGSGTFLAYRIESCSHPFPFKALKYQLSSLQKPRYKPGPEHRAAQAAAGADGKSGGGTSPPKDPGLVETDASKSITPQVFRRRATRKFTDLENKRVWGTSITKQLAVEQAAGKHHPSIEDHAVGEPSSEERVRAVTLTEAAESHVRQVAPQPFVRVTLEALALQNAVNVELLTTTRDGSNAVPLELLADEDGVIDDALLVRSGFKHRARLALAFALRAPESDRGALCIVIEASTIFPLVYPLVDEATNVADPDVALEVALRRCAADFLEVENSTPQANDMNAHGFRVKADDPEAPQIISAWAANLFTAPD